VRHSDRAARASESIANPRAGTSTPAPAVRATVLADFAAIILFCAASLLPPSAARAAQDADADAVAVDANTRLPDAVPDAVLDITGRNFPLQRGRIEVILNSQHPVSAAGGDNPLRITPSKSDGRTISFRLPTDIPPQRYHVALQITGDGKDAPDAAPIPVPGELRVKPKEPPKISAVKPLTGYPSDKKRFQFELTGENFAAKAEDNAILVNGSDISGRDDTQCNEKTEPGKHFDRPCVAAGRDGRRLSVFGYKPEDYQGPIKVQVRAYGALSAEQPMLLSRIGKDTALPIALAGALALTGILIAIVWRGLGRYKIEEERYSPFAVFFLDKSTNTYSLSKFQLFAWTAAAVFGYIYLMIANLLIQWKFALPDLPDGLPLLMGISTGTAVTALGITNQFGGKGSGPIHPSAADFITSGGLVAPERFQFFVWTIVGIMGFLSLLLLADPSTLHQMPKLPENFLTIMGISSAAYLGGKAVRKAGPVIKTLSIKSVTPAPQNPPNNDPPQDKPATVGPVLTINLKGDNLDAKGTIKVDDKVLRSDQFWIVPRLLPEPPSTMSAELDANLDAGRIDEASPGSLLEGEHNLTLVNGDGQSASIRFPLDPLEIERTSPASLSTGNAPVTVTLIGKNFGEGMTCQWKAPAADRATSANLTKVDPTQLTADITPGTAAGTGTITLISRLGLRAGRGIPVAEPTAQPAAAPADTQNP
jgi:hypothetical protein